MSVAGDLLLPTSGFVGLVTRAAVLAAMPLVLLATGFTHSEEREQARLLLARARRGIAREPA